MNQEEKPKNYIVSVFIVIFVIGFSLVSFMSSRRQEQPENTQTTPVVVPSPLPISYCGLTVTNPIPGSQIAFPLTLEASWENMREKTGCGWTVFEAQLGVVSITDSKGKKIAGGILTVAEEDLSQWMESSSFKAIANITMTDKKRVLISGENLMLTIDEENPSGNEGAKVITIPVVVK